MKNRIIILNKIGWIIVFILLLGAFLLTIINPSPEIISNMLQSTSSKFKILSMINHIIFLLIILVGIIFKKNRNIIFSLFLIYITISASISAIPYKIIPNIIIFSLISIIIIISTIKKRFSFYLNELNLIEKVFGSISLIFGFWYLHWVNSPVFFNALLFSPIGVLNCPTVLTLCGFFIINKNPELIILEIIIAITTLWLGFIGIFLLKAYIDIILIFVAIFILIRSGTYISQIKTINNFI